MVRTALLFLALVAAPLAARAEERITNFDVAINVQKDGDISVSETINVVSEGYQIQRGIFRDLPRNYLKDGRTLPYSYDVKSVTRDGNKEPYAIEKDGNAFRIRIGDVDVYIANGEHRYVIDYEVKNQTRYFPGYDEIYWNVTGNYWNFPIERASATITLPGAAGAVQTAGYTGALGQSGNYYEYAFQNGAHVFTTTKRLERGDGLTAAVGFEKGIVDPPSAADAQGEWWAANASFVFLGAAMLIIGALYLYFFEKFGRDPPKPPVFPRYEPPKGYSPAATHYVYHRGLMGHSALISTIVNLGVRRRIKIDVDKKKRTTLTPTAVGPSEGLSPIDVNLEARLLPGKSAFTFGEKYSSTMTSAYEQFRKSLAKTYGAPYFRWNRWQSILAALLTILAVVLAINFAIEWTSLHTLAVALLAAMAIAAAYFLPAPTAKGQEIRTEIEGFRLYMNTAEKLQLNAVEVGSDAPPPMTLARYETFLPYAIALGVEKPWTKHFEILLPDVAKDYQPRWTSGSYSGSRSLSGLTSGLVSSMSSGVAASMPQSSSSSGSGGGGSSGGGGGGGGGGGW